MKRTLLMLSVLLSLQSSAQDNTTALAGMISEKSGSNAVLSRFRYRAWPADNTNCKLRITEMVEVLGSKDPNPALYDIDLSKAVVGKNIRLVKGNRCKFYLQFDKSICTKNNKRAATLEIFFFLSNKKTAAINKELYTAIESLLPGITASCSKS